ncbi:hypothetical protein ARMSODRAFT_1030463, partial [Armillaria solidipes]
MGGPLFDWLRMMYSRVEYYVKHGGNTTELFSALIGLLTGDTSSPILWNIFFGDLKMPEHKDDVWLAGVVVSILAQADDVLLISHSAVGMQLKLNVLTEWCSLNFITISKIKTVMMAFGRVPSALPSFTVGGSVLEYSVKEKYVGVVFSSNTFRVYEKHLSEKASTARYYGHCIWGAEDRIGNLRPKDAKQLYMARVDCHLIHGCEIMPDAYKSTLQPLQDVQVQFVRRMLHLSSRSMIVPLFTETGIMPLAVRRFILVLSNLRYLMSLDHGHFAQAAMFNSIDLFLRSKSSWFGDLLKAGRNLPFLLSYELHPRDLSIDYIDKYIDMVWKDTNKWLQNEINCTDKLYLLHGRKEPQKNKPPAQVVLCMRHYLDVPVLEHRTALTRVLLSNHLLALERMRWSEYGKPKVQRDHRKCRFCRTVVESPEHALL